MKFKDIRTIHNPHYRISVSLNYLEEYVSRLITTYNLDLNPDFQRGYIWTAQQQIDYMEFILKEPPTGRELYFNCPGWMNNFKGPMEIVDGKQRLNTVICFLQNKVPIFNGNYLSDFEDNLRSTRSELFININNLRNRKDILQWYLDLNTGGTVHTEDELNKVKELLKDVGV